MATTNVDGATNSDVPVGHPVQLEGVEVHYFQSTVLRRIYYSPPMRRFINATMRDVDIVHTHSVFLWPTTMAARVARKAGKPYVVSPRGMLVGNLIDRRSALPKRAWIRLFERKNICNATAVHVTSAVEEQEMRALGLAPRRVITIGNGVDVPQVPALEERPGPLNNRYILFLGRLSWKKGIERLLAALARLSDVRLVIAGNDEEGYWPRIVDIARELAILDRIQYVGFVQGETKDNLLANARLLVLPSLSENFGNVVIEAMAVGCPVVVTPEVGASEVVRESGAGIVLAGHVDALADGLRKLLADEKGRMQMGSKGREYVRVNCSWAVVGRKMEEAYVDLLEHQPASLP